MIEEAAYQSPFVRRSGEAKPRCVDICVIGLPGSGKTMLIATASSEFVGWPTEKWEGPLRYLPDVCVASVDRAATLPLKERGYSVSEFSIAEFLAFESEWGKKFSKKPTWEAVAKFAVEELANSSPRFGTLAIDNLSVLDGKIKRGLIRKAKRDVKPGYSLDMRTVFGEVQDRMAAFWDAVCELPWNVLFLCHGKSTGEDMISEAKDSEAAKARRASLRTAAGGEILPALTGGASLLFKVGPSFTFGLVPNKSIGPKGEVVYDPYLQTVRMEGSEFDFETKSRASLSLNPREPANIFKIMEKIS